MVLTWQAGRWLPSKSLRYRSRQVARCLVVLLALFQCICLQKVAYLRQLPFSRRCLEVTQLMLKFYWRGLEVVLDYVSCVSKHWFLSLQWSWRVTQEGLWHQPMLIFVSAMVLKLYWIMFNVSVNTDFYLCNGLGGWHRKVCGTSWCWFLGGLSLDLNHLIASRTGISFRQFGTLPIGIFLSNLDSRHLMTSPRTLLG